MILNPIYFDSDISSSNYASVVPFPTLTVEKAKVDLLKVKFSNL
jgi:hypothetical protein